MARTAGSTAETTRPRIRAAAERLFAEAGYDAVTMRGIGAEVGLRAGALYRYFPDKESLATELLDAALAERDRVLDAAPRGDPVEALEGFTSAYLRWHMGAGGAAALIAQVSPALGRSGEARPEARLEALLETGQASGAVRLPDLRVGARAVLAVLDLVAADTRLPEDRRLRIGWRFVQRLVAA